MSESFCQDERLLGDLLIRASWALTLTAVLALVLALHGCGPSRTVAPASGEALGLRALTPHGTVVQFLRVHDRSPALEAACLAEIDAAGVPDGWTVHVELPAFVVQWSDGGPLEVQGETLLAERVIRVGTALESASVPHLPALAWEVGNARRGYEPASVAESIPPLGGTP